MEEAILHYLNTKDTLEKTASLFSLDRKRLSKEIKQKFPDFKTLKFVNVSNIIHKNKYNYSKTVYKNARSKVKIICSIHGEFEQEAFSHWKGCECFYCGLEKTRSKKFHSTEKFITLARKAHGDFYSYDKSIFVNNRSKITITCLLHGDFLQSPDDHKQGKGCSKCAKENIGWTKTKWKNKGKNRIAKLYIILCNNEKESFIKIGRTFNNIKKRFASKKELPYSWSVVKVFESFDYDYIFDLEILLHRKYKEYKYIPEIHFEGKQECFKIDILKELQDSNDIL